MRASPPDRRRPRERCCATTLSINTALDFPVVTQSGKRYWRPCCPRPSVGLNAFQTSVRPSSGVSRDGSYGTYVTYRPPSLPVGLRIIGVQQLIRLQIGYTFPRNCGSRKRSTCGTTSEPRPTAAG
jgi:hypothetical protein